MKIPRVSNNTNTSFKMVSKTLFAIKLLENYKESFGRWPTASRLFAGKMKEGTEGRRLADGHLRYLQISL